MATTQDVYYTDDLTGERLDSHNTVSFGLDGKSYEIDLSTDHAAELRDTMAVYVAHARRVGTTPSKPGKASAAPTGAQEARTWLRDNGYTVPQRGRLPKDLQAAYEARDPAPEDLVVPMVPDENGAPTVDTSDAAVLAWHKLKGYQVPAGDKVNGLMRHRYLKAQDQPA